MGFAAIENVFYVFYSDDPIITAVSRSLTAVPAHACFGVIMGLYFGMARFTFRKKRLKYLIISVLLAAIAHGFYNFFLFIGTGYWPLMSLLVLVICIVISLRIISRFKRLSPFRKKYTLITHRKRIKTLEEIEAIERRKAYLRSKLGLKYLKKDDTTFREGS
jgi:protease PrsW